MTRRVLVSDRPDEPRDKETLPEWFKRAIPSWAKQLFSQISWLIKHAPDHEITEAEISAGVTPTNFQYEPGDVRRYGAVGDGATNDTAAIQRAVDVAEVAGGTVIFPSGGYKWGLASQVTVSSLFPVHLVGDMNATPNATADASYIKPLNNISGSLIKYESPTASVNEGGGGKIRGLAFMDDSDPDNSTIDSRRVFTMDAALNLDSFSLSSVEDCEFHCIKGSAIRLGFCVMSNFDKLWIRYCGASGLPALDHPNVANRAVQSCVFSAIRAEVNFDEPYIYVHNTTNTQDNKFIGCGFEAIPASASTGDGIETFIDYRGAFTSFVACHFNRNAEVYAIELGGQNNVVASCVFNLNYAGAVHTTGQYNVIVGINAAAASSDIPTILFEGAHSRIADSFLYFANGIYIDVGYCSVVGVDLKDCNVDTGTTYLIEGTANATAMKVANCRLRNQNSVRAVSPSGIGYGNVHALIQGNFLHGNSASVGIFVGASDGIVSGNWLDGYTTEINPNGHMDDAFVERNFGFATEADGTSSITSGNTNVDVTHGLGYTPAIEDIRIMFSQQATNDYGRFWVSNITSTQFRLNVSADPGASGLGFGWAISPR